MLIETKLTPPKLRAELVKRGKLLQQLDGILRVKLAIVSAPAGFGKSTLLAQWTQSRRETPIAVGWLSLDEGDDDFGRFIEHFVAALQKLAPNVGREVLALVRSSPVLPTDSILAALVNTLANVKQEVVLILDDGHFLTRDEITAFLDALIAYAPPNFHLVVSTRSRVPLRIGSMRVRGQVFHLEEANLKFSLSEASEYLNSVCGLQLEDSQVMALQYRTEGWIAGLHGLKTHAEPIQARDYTVDVDALRSDAHCLKPKLITIGGSLNLFPHPIADIRVIADEVGAIVMFDDAHMSGMIAGRASQQPLEEGAHVTTMSTYKSPGGPPSGLIITNEVEIAQHLDAIVYPGMTANYDAAKSAALAMTLLDWKEFGLAYGKAMAASARTLAAEIAARGIRVFAGDRGGTTSHQFAIETAGQASARHLRQANTLACGIGLPLPEVEGDLNGLRFGTPEIERWGMSKKDMPQIAAFIADALTGKRQAQSVAPEVAAFRTQFKDLHFIRK